jgi:hypothetical protein
MGVETVLATIGDDVKTFYAKLAADLKKARQVWLLIASPQTRNVLVALGADAIKLVKDATAAAGSKGFSLALDGAVVADIAQLIKDAETGDAVVLADLKALGIVL